MVIPIRKDWQKIRNDCGVKQGAAKVNMGEAFETYHKDAAKGLGTRLKAITKLKDKINTYLQTVKNPALTTILQAMIKNDMDPYNKLAPHVTELNKAVTAWKSIKSNPTQAGVTAIGKLLDPVRTATQSPKFAAESELANVTHGAWKYFYNTPVSDITGKYKTTAADAMAKLEAFIK